MSPTLRRYLDLERLMLALDAFDQEAAADAVRDAMDPLWHALSSAEREVLNRRDIGELKEIERIRLPSDHLFIDPVECGDSPSPKEPINGWRIPA